MYVSKRGIHYVLSQSPYCAHFPGLDMFFSSMNYLEKFQESYPHVRERLSNEFKRRFKLDCDTSRIAAVKTYLECEKRGFYVVVEGVPVEWPDHLELYGIKLRAKR